MFSVARFNYFIKFILWVKRFLRFLFCIEDEVHLVLGFYYLASGLCCFVIGEPCDKVSALSTVEGGAEPTCSVYAFYAFGLALPEALQFVDSAYVNALEVAGPFQQVVPLPFCGAALTSFGCSVELKARGALPAGFIATFVACPNLRSVHP
jgi:hypothetical protein